MGFKISSCHCNQLKKIIMKKISCFGFSSNSVGAYFADT